MITVDYLDRSALSAAIASGVLFLACLGLLLFVRGVDRAAPRSSFSRWRGRPGW
jgi:DMSO reductase anchor subunit